MRIAQTTEERRVYMKAYRAKPETKIKQAEWSKNYYAIHQEKHAAYLAANRERILARDASYRAAHKKERAAYYADHRQEAQVRDTAYRASHKEQHSTRWLLRKWGLSKPELASMIDRQGSSCAICHKTDWGWHGPHIDHNHVSNKVRGILCRNCNLALGHIKDDPDIAQAMANYLKRNRS